jgi:hypothetical protein
MLAAAQVETTYELLILENDEILSNLNDLEIPCTMNDLVKPTSERIMMIYEQFIRMLLGPRALPPIVPAVALQQGEQGLLQDSLSLMNFHRKM